MCSNVNFYILKLQKFDTKICNTINFVMSYSVTAFSTSIRNVVLYYFFNDDIKFNIIVNYSAMALNSMVIHIYILASVYFQCYRIAKYTPPPPQRIIAQIPIRTH